MKTKQIYVIVLIIYFVSDFHLSRILFFLFFVHIKNVHKLLLFTFAKTSKTLL